MPIESYKASCSQQRYLWWLPLQVFNLGFERDNLVDEALLSIFHCLTDFHKLFLGFRESL